MPVHSAEGVAVGGEDVRGLMDDQAVDLDRHCAAAADGLHAGPPTPPATPAQGLNSGEDYAASGQARTPPSGYGPASPS